MSAEKTPELIRAAGGLLWREQDGQREILVIHRVRYDDWALPKGKLKVGERWDEAALREVAEESGYQACLSDFAGDTFYYVEERPKIVLYWNMRVVAEIPQAERKSDSPDEGDEVRWLSAEEALNLISYEDEKQLLKKEETAMNQETEYQTSFPKNPLVESRKWFQRLWREQSAERLGISLELYYREMDQLQAATLNSGIPRSQGYFAAIAARLSESAEALKNGEVELGWGAFNAAQRIEIQLYSEMCAANPDTPLKNYASVMFNGIAERLLAEGQNKLSGWRLETLKSLLLDKETKKLKAPLELGAVLFAQRLLCEYFENIYRRLKIITEQIRFLEIIALVALAIWIGLLIFTTMFDGAEINSQLSLSTLALIFGVLGACISGILRLEKRTTHQRIPNQLESRVHTLARPLVGAVSALGVVHFILAGIVNVGTQTAGLYMAAAFAAGFSERLLQFSVDQIGGGEGAEKKEK